MGHGQVSKKSVENAVPSAKSGTFVASKRSPDRPLDDYNPTVDVVAPISIRTSMMELLWICGDCGEHYPRASDCPEQCEACSAPKQHFYAPLED